MLLFEYTLSILSIEYMYIFIRLIYPLNISTELSKSGQFILEINSWVCSDNTTTTVGIQEESPSLWASRWLTHPLDYKDNTEHSNLCCVFLISNGTMSQSQSVSVLYVFSPSNQSCGLVGSHVAPEIKLFSQRDLFLYSMKPHVIFGLSTSTSTNACLLSISFKGNCYEITEQRSEFNLENFDYSPGEVAWEILSLGYFSCMAINTVIWANCRRKE